MEPIVSTEWLLKEIGSNDVRVVDATAFLADAGRDARAEYEAEHIPGAVFFDLYDIVDSSSGLPFTLPPPEKFASRVQALGIGDGSRIVVYDNSPLKTAARVWWMFRIFGVNNVAVLDGGLAAWKAAGGGLESGKPVLRHRHFTPLFDKAEVRDLAAMRDNLKTGAAQVVDARSAARFTAAEPEPRPGLRSGHMPGARNLPHGALYDDTGRLKDDAGLKAAFDAAGVDLAKPIIATCGSGITAASIVLAAEKLGVHGVALYDGSWAEWGSVADTPVVTGN